ncbi:MAG: PD-(D/E)XK nuclease family protein [Candidatus Lokiarchaeota archaeon]|nr:PD-(D/E)XK nuclease family protein [Candidatus Lokiarchaeota archaeon]
MPFDSISPEIKQTILNAKENGMTRMQICLQYGFDWETVLQCLNEISDHIIERNMYHQGFQYSFRWLKHRHLSFQQHRDSQLLHQYLLKITQDRYPKDIFNNKDIQRISQFRLNRLKRGKVSEIGKILRNEGSIQETLSIHDLTKIAKHTFAEYVTAQKQRPSHNDIQFRILEKDPHTIAMEVPVWGRPPISSDIITGHIDLIRIIEDTIQIVDYKPEDSFMPSIPQVAFYGILLQKKLNLSEVRCASFSKKKIWEYKPDILYRINELLLEHNIRFFSWQRFL